MNNIVIKKSVLLLFLLIPLSFHSLHAQVSAQILDKLNLYLQKYPEESVYMQTDRSLYAPGETMWFSAWILQDLGSSPDLLSRYIYISLIDQDSVEIINQTLPLNTRVFNGNFAIPKAIQPGLYKLIAYTSWMKNTPVDRIFSREITIEDNSRNGFTVAIQLKDTISMPGSSLVAHINTSDMKGLPVSASFNYRLMNDQVAVTSGKGKTDKEGDAKVDITLPSFSENDVLTLMVDASYKGTERSSGVIIPVAENYFNVLFYPEGGTLLYGIESKVAFRSFNDADRPVDFKGIIMSADHKPVATVSSSYKGIGSFSLTPVKGQTYYLKVTSPSGISKTFKLPDPRRAGLALRVQEQTEDTVTLVIEQTSMYSNVYHLFGQVKGKVYWMSSAKTSHLAKFKVPLSDFPAGVAEFSAFDTLKNLLAKRLIYINENKQLHIALKTDKKSYGPREKVNLTVEVTDFQGKPVQANLMLSVNNSMLTHPDNPDFFTFTTLKSDLIGHIPTPPFYFSTDPASKRILDDLLIANAFKRFTWKTVLETTRDNPSFVTMDKDAEPVTNIEYDRNMLAYFTQDLINSTKTPGEAFSIYPSNDMQLILNPDVPKNKGMDYTTMKDVPEIVYSVKPYKLIDGKIVFHSSSPNSLLNQQGAGIAIDGVYRGTDPTIMNALMPMDIARVVVSTNPIDIQRYTGLNTMGIIEIFTKSGSPQIRLAEEKKENEKYDIHMSFDSPDYGSGKSNTRSGNDLRRTIYWNPDIHTGPSGKTTISFYNGDIPSKVTITAEGKSADNNSLPGSAIITYEVQQ